MKITSDTSSRLEQLRQEQKFVEEDFYPGAPTDEIRTRCEQRVNVFVDKVRQLLNQDAEEAALLALADEMEQTFAEEDTEEREKVTDYIGEVLRILEIDAEQ